jgi:hypothetical protein
MIGVPRCSAKSVWALGNHKNHGDLRFNRAPVVSMPIAVVVNTLASWLCWMTSSYVVHLGTKMTSLRLACLST